MAEKMANARPMTFPDGGIAVVIGASGGIGRQVVSVLDESGRFSGVVRAGRRCDVRLDLTSEASIAAAADEIAALGGEVRLIFDATGFLHDPQDRPEKTWRQLSAEGMARAFALNAIGPALLIKHFLPLLPREGRSVFATLSAKVGSIGDNRLGGWYSYRASKAALNQIVRTAAVELARSRPEALCVALHPGTVDTPLSRPFAKAGLEVQPPEDAARALVACLDRLSAEDSGGFFDRTGTVLPW